MLALSSYDLLELLDHMPEDGAFKTAMERGGRWPDWKQILAESVNEAYRLRAVYQGVNGGEDAFFDAEDYEFIDPALQVMRDEAAAIAAEEQALAQQEFDAEIGYSRPQEEG